jgi:hypothetical protein
MSSFSVPLDTIVGERLGPTIVAVTRQQDRAMSRHPKTPLEHCQNLLRNP